MQIKDNIFPFIPTRIQKVAETQAFQPLSYSLLLFLPSRLIEVRLSINFAIRRCRDVQLRSRTFLLSSPHLFWLVSEQPDCQWSFRTITPTYRVAAFICAKSQSFLKPADHFLPLPTTYKKALKHNILAPFFKKHKTSSPKFILSLSSQSH